MATDTNGEKQQLDTNKEENQLIKSTEDALNPLKAVKTTKQIKPIPSFYPPFTGYVYGLQKQNTEIDIRQIFHIFKISAIRWLPSNRTSFVAAIDFSQRAELITAINLKKFEFDGRTITIKLDKPNEPIKMAANNPSTNFIDDCSYYSLPDAVATSGSKVEPVKFQKTAKDQHELHEHTIEINVNDLITSEYTKMFDFVTCTKYNIQFYDESEQVFLNWNSGANEATADDPPTEKLISKLNSISTDSPTEKMDELKTVINESISVYLSFWVFVDQILPSAELEPIKTDLNIKSEYQFDGLLLLYGIIITYNESNEIDSITVAKVTQSTLSEESINLLKSNDLGQFGLFVEDEPNSLVEAKPKSFEPFVEKKNTAQKEVKDQTTRLLKKYGNVENLQITKPIDSNKSTVTEPTVKTAETEKNPTIHQAVLSKPVQSCSESVRGKVDADKSKPDPTTPLVVSNTKSVESINELVSGKVDTLKSTTVSSDVSNDTVVNKSHVVDTNQKVVAADQSVVKENVPWPNGREDINRMRKTVISYYPPYLGYLYFLPITITAEEIQSLYPTSKIINIYWFLNPDFMQSACILTFSQRSELLSALRVHLNRPRIRLFPEPIDKKLFENFHSNPIAVSSAKIEEKPPALQEVAKANENKPDEQKKEQTAPPIEEKDDEIQFDKFQFNPKDISNYPPYTAYLHFLPEQTTEQDVRTIFNQLKILSVKLMLSANRNDSKCRFEFCQKAELITALQMDNLVVHGKNIQVSLLPERMKGEGMKTANNMVKIVSGSGLIHKHTRLGTHRPQEIQEEPKPTIALGAQTIRYPFVPKEVNTNIAPETPIVKNVPETPIVNKPPTVELPAFNEKDVPTAAPFHCLVRFLPVQTSEKDIRNLWPTLTISSIKLSISPHKEKSEGLVVFGQRNDLIQALKLQNPVLYGRDLQIILPSQKMATANRSAVTNQKQIGPKKVEPNDTTVTTIGNQKVRNPFAKISPQPEANAPNVIKGNASEKLPATNQTNRKADTKENPTSNKNNRRPEPNRQQLKRSDSRDSVATISGNCTNVGRNNNRRTNLKRSDSRDSVATISGYRSNTRNSRHSNRSDSQDSEATIVESPASDSKNLQEGNRGRRRHNFRRGQKGGDDKADQQKAKTVENVANVLNKSIENASNISYDTLTDETKSKQQPSADGNSKTDYKLLLKHMPISTSDREIGNLCKGLGNVVNPYKIFRDFRNKLVYIILSSKSEADYTMKGINNQNMGIEVELIESQNNKDNNYKKRRFNHNRRQGNNRNDNNNNNNNNKDNGQSNQRDSGQANSQNKSEFYYKKNNTESFNLQLDGACILCVQKTGLTCSQCGRFYCSVECQRNDWPKHAVICTPIPPLIPSTQFLEKSEKTTPIPRLMDIVVPARVEEKQKQLQKFEKPAFSHQPQRIPISEIPKSSSHVKITAIIDAKHLFVRSTDSDSYNEYLANSKKISEFIANINVTLTDQPKPGCVVLALNDETKSYARALVLQLIDANKFVVAFIDYGHIKFIDSYKLCRELSVELQVLKRFAHKVTLRTNADPSSLLIVNYLASVQDLDMEIVYEGQFTGTTLVELFVLTTGVSINRKIDQLCAEYLPKERAVE